MKLGGFVIHADAMGVIEPCLDSLAATCDRLVTIDTGSQDGTAALAERKGFTVLRRPWEGYGAARAEAVKALADCDWVLFLDSDEWLDADAIAAIRALKASPPQVPCVSFSRRNWAELKGDRFVYQHEHPVRLARLEQARFDRRMIVHEAIPPGPTLALDAVIEHRYVTDITALRAKVGRYALLWALRQHVDGRGPRSRSPGLQWSIHMLRDLLLRGAAFSGRSESFEIAAIFADYHACKYALLNDIRAGQYAGLVTLLREDRLEEFFRTIPPDVELERRSWFGWLTGRAL
jgi:(heptosyl)LPS beta-1,4-glucosyltransferase